MVLKSFSSPPFFFHDRAPINMGEKKTKKKRRRKVTQTTTLVSGYTASKLFGTSFMRRLSFNGIDHIVFPHPSLSKLFHVATRPATGININSQSISWTLTPLMSSLSVFLTSALFANWECAREPHVSYSFSNSIRVPLDLNEASCSKQGINYNVLLPLRLNVTGTRWQEQKKKHRGGIRTLRALSVFANSYRLETWDENSYIWHFLSFV